MILIKNATVITGGVNSRAIPEGAILIDGEKIAAVGKEKSLIKKLNSKKITTIDAKNRLVMPGFICAHHHLYSTFARGMLLEGEPAKNFPEILEKLWWKLDKNLDSRQFIFQSCQAPLIECIRAGTTTIFDHHESQGKQLNSLDYIQEAVEKVGIRACLTLGVSDRYNQAEDGLKENVRFLKKLTNQKGNLITAMVGLHASFTVTNETLKSAVKIANDFGVGIHTHCAEDRTDQIITEEKYGQQVVERFYQHGALTDKTILAHGIHLSNRELELIRATRAIVVHNPESNMNNAVGTANVLKMLEKEILVGLGTDGMSSNMLQQMRCAYLLQRNFYADPTIFFLEAPKLLLDNNARIAQNIFGIKIGYLEVGYVADVIIVDYIPPTPLNQKNFLGHLLFGIVNAPVDTTIVNGKILMKNKKLTGLSEEKILAVSRQTARRFWKKIKEKGKANENQNQ